MRLPIPKNKIVGLTLIGALLTVLLAVGLATPNLIQKQGQDKNTIDPAKTNSITLKQTSNPPKPNQNFTPTVQKQPLTQKQYEEYEEYEEEREEEDEYEENNKYEEY